MIFLGDLDRIGLVAEGEIERHLLPEALIEADIAQLLRGYQQFARSDTQLTLVGSIVGSDAPLQPFADLFEHVPHQTRPALAQRYRSSDVFVFPTLIEGMPLVVLEAMACGRPVVSTELSTGTSWVNRHGDTGLVVPPRDPRALAAALRSRTASFVRASVRPCVGCSAS